MVCRRPAPCCAETAQNTFITQNNCIVNNNNNNNNAPGANNNNNNNNNVVCPGGTGTFNSASLPSVVSTLSHPKHVHSQPPCLIPRCDNTPALYVMDSSEGMDAAREARLVLDGMQT